MSCCHEHEECDVKSNVMTTCAFLRSIYHRRYPLISPSVTSPSSSYIPLDEDSDVNMSFLPIPSPSLRPIIHTVIPATIPVRKQLTVRVCAW